VLRRASPRQRSRFKSVRRKVRQRANLARRPKISRPKPATRVVRHRARARFTRDDRRRLTKLSSGNRAVAALLRARGGKQGVTAVAAARKSFATLSDPQDKLALSRALRSSRYLDRQKSLVLLRTARGWPERRRVIANKLLTGLALTAQEVAFLRQEWQSTDDAAVKRALGSAIRDGLFLTRRRRTFKGWQGLGGSYYPGGLPFAHNQGQAADEPADPYVRFANPGEDPDDPNAGCVELSVAPGQNDPTLRRAPPDADNDDQLTQDPAQEVEELDPAAESLETQQTTRGLRLHNGTRKKVVFYVQYCAPEGQGSDNWFPRAKPDGNTKGALRYEVEPGQTVESLDNDWGIHANRVRVWAESDGRKWEQFRGRDLPLVTPEEDEAGGKSAYRDVVPQDAVFTVR
jgi:hypothetical protein